VANQWLSPPAAGGLPCGWATAHKIMKALKQTTTMSNAQKRSVFDVERFLLEIVAWPVTLHPAMTLVCLCLEHYNSYT